MVTMAKFLLAYSPLDTLGEFTAIVSPWK